VVEQQQRARVPCEERRLHRGGTFHSVLMLATCRCNVC
jgi:hypothetical protein